MEDTPGGAWRRRRSSVGSAAGSFHAGRLPTYAEPGFVGERRRSSIEPNLNQVLEQPISQPEGTDGVVDAHGHGADSSQEPSQNRMEMDMDMGFGLEEHDGRAGMVVDVTGSGSSGAASSAGSARQGLVDREFQVDLSSMFALPRAPSVGPEGRGGMSKEEFQEWKKKQAERARERMEKLEKKFKALRAQGVLDGGVGAADHGIEKAHVVGGMTHPQPRAVVRGRPYAGDMDRTSKSTGGVPSFQKSISKEDLRDIIREEVRQGLEIKEEAKHLQLHSDAKLHIDSVTTDKDADGRPLAATGGWKTAFEEPKQPLFPGNSKKGAPVASFARGEAKQRASMKNILAMQAGGADFASIRSNTLESSQADDWIGISHEVHHGDRGPSNFASVYADTRSSNGSSPMQQSPARSPMLKSTRAKQIEQVMELPATMSDFDSNLLSEGKQSLVGTNLLAAGAKFEGLQFSRAGSAESKNSGEREQTYKEVSDNAKRAWEKLRGMKGNLIALLYEASKKDRVYGPGMLQRGKTMKKGSDFDDNDPLGVGAKTGQLNAAQRAIVEQSERFKEKYLLNPRTIGDCVEYSLGIPLLFKGFSRASYFRNQCFQIQKSGRWLLFFTLVTIMQCAYVALEPSLVVPIDSPNYLAERERIEAEAAAEGGIRGTFQARFQSWLDYIDPFCIAVLLFEIVTGLVAFGGFRSLGSYIRSSGYNQMDVIILVLTIVEYIVTALVDNAGLNFKPLRIMRMFKALTNISIFAGIKTIIITLRSGAGQLSTVFAMLFFFMCAWGIFGMAMFKKSYRRRCVTTDIPIDPCFSDFTTGWAPRCNFTEREPEPYMYPGGESVILPGYPWERWCKIIKNSTAGQYDKRYPTDVFGNYHNCGHDIYKSLIKAGMDHVTASASIKQSCKEGANPNNGFVHWDNIGGALTALSLATSGDSYYDVLWRGIMSEPESVGLTFLFFFAVTCFNTFLLLGIFVAVVTGTFARVREEYGSAFLSPEDLQMERKKALRDMWVFAVGELRKRIVKARAKGEPVVLEVDEVQEVAWAISNNAWFKHFFSAVCVVHGIAMASDQWDAPVEIRQFVTYAYIVCNLLFLSECWVIFAGSGTFTQYFQSRKNKFEMAMVVSGVLGLITNSSILLLAPALRLYRLMRYLPTLEALLISAVSSVQAIFNLGIFIVIIAICVSVIGRYIFRSSMDEISRSNYGSFGRGMLSTFQILTGDSWTGLLVSAMSTKDTIHGQMLACLFVIGWFVFSALVVFNLFVAVIIENFQVKETMDNIARPGNVSRFQQVFRSSFGRFFKESANARARETGMAGGATEQGLDKGDALTNKVAPEEDIVVMENKDDDLFGFLSDEVNFTSDIAVVLRSASIAKEVRVAAVKIAPPERVLFLFGPNNIIRRAFVYLSTQVWFDIVVYAAISGSVAFLMITPPANDIPGDPPILDIGTMDNCNSLFTFIFTLEFFSRVMATGLYYTQHAYLKDWWNAIDFLVLFFAWVDEANLVSNGKIAKVIRLSRALRPLRLMKRNVNMRLVIDALIRTLPPVFYVIAFSVFTFMVFALIGMGLFGGKFASCYPGSPATDYPGGKEECVGTFVLDDGWQVGVMKQRSWVTDFYNFDSFASAGLTLFRVNTLKYVGLMVRAVDTTEIGKSPSENYRPEMATFFILYIVIGALFVMNLFVGFIVDGFNANKGSTPADVNYSRFYRQIQAYKPVYPRYKAPLNAISVTVRRITDHPNFSRFSSLCVAVNIIFMLTDSADATGYHLFIIETQNNVFFGTLCLEVMLNTIAYGPGVFIDDSWKGFDLFICVGSAMGPIIGNQFANVARSLRLLRIVVLMNQIKPIRVILETLIACLPALSNILILLFLVYSIFAVVAVQLFGTAKYGWRFGPTANFQSYANAILTVMQMITGDEWQDILADLSITPPFCTPIFREGPDSPGYSNFRFGDLSFGDCGTSLAPIFFILFKLVCEDIMLNLFVGMILDNFAFITEEDDVEESHSNNWEKGSPAEVIIEIAKIFSKFDGRTGSISVSSLPSLMIALPSPMGFRGPDGKITFKSREKAQLRVIRAELNVILRQSHMDDAEAENEEVYLKKLWRKIMSPGRAFVNSVTFEEVMLTILHWKLPNMVPVSVQIGRATRVEEVGLMTYAIVCMEFFRLVHGRRRHRRVLRALKDRIEFRKWSLLDVPRRRRSLNNKNIREKEQELVAKLKRHTRYLKVEPLKTLNIELAALGHSAALMELHEKALYRIKRKFPKPGDGLALFLEKAQKDLVVLKYVDARQKEQDLVVADLSEVQWEGWEQQNKTDDSFLFPLMIDPSPEFAEKWTKLDLVVKAFVAKAKHRFVGSVLDIQSFMKPRSVREEELRAVPGLKDLGTIPRKAKKYNKDANVVRLNLGTYRWCTIWPAAETEMEREDRLKQQQPEPIRLPKMFDSVMEVMGYIDRVHANAILAGTSRKNKVQETAKRDLTEVLDDENTLAEHVVRAKNKLRNMSGAIFSSMSRAASRATSTNATPRLSVLGTPRTARSGFTPRTARSHKSAKSNQSLQAGSTPKDEPAASASPAGPPRRVARKLSVRDDEGMLHRDKHNDDDDDDDDDDDLSSSEGEGDDLDGDHGDGDGEGQRREDGEQVQGPEGVADERLKTPPLALDRVPSNDELEREEEEEGGGSGKPPPGVTSVVIDSESDEDDVDQFQAGGGAAVGSIFQRTASMQSSVESGGEEEEWGAKRVVSRKKYDPSAALAPKRVAKRSVERDFDRQRVSRNLLGD